MKEISPANRISEVSEYYFSVKLREIAQMNAEGADVINLGIGSPDLPPAEDVVSTLGEEAARETSHGYQPYIGIPELRNAFAAWYRRWYGVELDPASEILPLMGSKEGIMHISMAFVNEGDAVLVPNPGYPTYTSVSRLVGAKIIPYDLSAENNWEPDLEALEAQHAAGEIDLNSVKLLWCNYPNMPTGANGSIPLFERLVAFGRKYNIIICHDNPYSFILNDKPLSILMVEGAKDICIELNSMSKSHNMPGWRIGMLATNPRFREWILRVKSNMDSGMFRPLQLAAVKALEQPEEWYREMNEVYRRRRALAEAILRRVGAEVAPGQVGLFLWGKVDGRGVEICDQVLYGAKVFITPGFIFGSNGENYIRISLCANEETLGRALQRIEKEYNKQ
ncbi:MAG: aminotransferase class I/II-fold pyridoxal phosphate-dependent enzyme [Bacteroidales bacterium]|nr:aminotransferase class I/II-fold pyridoxal phosphate-dependent enzyme [Bacteroidales bacterium]MBO7764319.1 aminotransferase class I/II-fold pyridoxal phosphate-dependent enzyme [Bacteroidales bacterium]